MPAVSKENRPSRKGHYSCDFCRGRKLRCSRPLPCTNCVSRGKECQFGPAAAGPPAAAANIAQDQHEHPPQHQPQYQEQHHQPVFTATHSLSPPQEADPDQGSLLSEIQALRKLAQDLEKRVGQGTVSAGHQRDDNGTEFSQSASTTYSPSVPRVDAGSSSSPGGPGLGQVGDVVAHLDRVSMGQNTQEPIYVDNDLAFKVERIRAISLAPSYTAHLGKPTRCVWLPRHDEARVLLDTFVTNVGYIHHVTHHPSLPDAIDDVYRQIEGQGPIKPGHLVLLLSIVASATHVWEPRDDDVDGESALFPSAAQAHAQTPLWIKATHDVLNAVHNRGSLALETVQGIAILSFLVCNLEGVSLRYRSLISMGLFLSRELGLYRIDHASNAATANTVRAEMGRRVWWYLVATDWLMATRYGGPGQGTYQAHPCQMMVKKPRSINDVDLFDNKPDLELPVSQPTEMSYFLQRIRLAEISRSIVDHNPMVVTSTDEPSYRAHLMALDVELNRMIYDLPSFFNLDSYNRNPESTTNGIFIQAYLLNSLLYTQRCKLHLAYLTSAPNNSNSNPAHMSSRETCLQAARQILRAEKQLERAQHPFVQTRLRLSAMLYSLFMASIVFLMDACVHGTGSQQHDGNRQDDLAETLRIIGTARNHSLTAANLYESLTQVLARHRA